VRKPAPARCPRAWGFAFTPRPVHTLLVVRIFRVLVVFGVLTALVVATPAVAARESGQPPCWNQLVTEWYGGAITTIFPLHCYVQALGRLPGDILVFSSAKRDIRAAEIAAEHGKQAPPEKPLSQPRVLPATKKVPLPSLLPCVTRIPGQGCA
jgi:hypothetical protein